MDFHLGGQLKTHRAPDLKIPKGTDHSCVYQPKYSATKRLQFYPFNVCDTVKLVSYRYHWDNSPIRKDIIIKDSLIEAKVLQSQDINKLTDILYNNFYKEFGGFDVMAMCWSPRNAILFIDKTGKLKEAVIICFHCMEYRVSTGKNNVIGDDCNEKMEKLRKFFIAQGIQFGTKQDDVELYPGETNGNEPVIVSLDSNK